MECDGRDLADDVVEVGQHFASWVVGDADVLLDQPSVARYVSVGTIASVVSFAVNFDRESGWGAVEVQDVGACCVLFTEAEAFFIAS